MAFCTGINIQVPTDIATNLLGVYSPENQLFCFVDTAKDVKTCDLIPDGNDLLVFRMHGERNAASVDDAVACKPSEEIGFAFRINFAEELVINCFVSAIWI